MRNTDLHPIILDEMIDACERAAADIVRGWEQNPETMPIGDITPLALTETAKLLRQIAKSASAIVGQRQAPTNRHGETK